MVTIPRVTLLLSVLAICATAGSCELVIDAEDDGSDADAATPDSTFDGGAVPDAIEASCEFEPLYEAAGITNSLYRVLAADRFDVARARCLADGADLVSIGSPAEEADMMFLVVANLPTQNNCPTGRCAFVGLTQAASATPENGWTWVDGSASPMNWAFEQPDDADGAEDGVEDCAVFDESGLFDVSCDIEQFAICECRLGPNP